MISGRVGLVLSGGGMRGMAHIGVIQAVREANIDVGIVTGTSIGALVGAMYSMNISTDKMIEIFKSISIFSFRNYTYGKPGLIHTLKFQRHFQEHFGEDSFEHLSKELIVNATNLTKGKHRVFRRGELFRPLLSSVAYPGIMTPIKIDNDYYADGGITNNFPIETIKYECDFVIGSYANPLKQVEINKLRNSFTVLERVIQVMMYTMEENSFSAADLFIMPRELSSIPLFSLKHIDKTVEMGYQEAKKQLKRL